MSHDKIKAAARERMARTGEPYASARREVIAEIQAAAAAHEELGPEYSDAVVAAFLDRVEEEIAIRVEARMAETPRRTAATATAAPADENSRRAMLRGIAIGIAIGVFVVSAIGGNANEHAHRLMLLVLACVVIFAATGAVRQVRGALRRPAAPSAPAGRTTR
ncbi:MAG: hypothetical protein ABSB59_14340 [Streptosporangiaceae bacterium]|jgi:hypothetical protein